MGKWADYCIVGVHFATDHKWVDTVRILPDTGDLLVTGLIMARQQIIAGIRRGMTFTTALPDPVQLSYTKGPTVSIVSIDGGEYLRTDTALLAADNLGDVPEF
jgi:hypothetical protein